MKKVNALKEQDVTRYDGASGMYLAYKDGTDFVSVINAYDHEVSGTFTPDYHGEAIIGMHNAKDMLRRYVNDPSKVYGEYAGLWKRG